MLSSVQELNHLSQNINHSSNSKRVNSVNVKQRSEGKYCFNIDVYNSFDPERSQVETFIKEGFYKAYQASISITMPTLLAVKNGAFKAALGIRYTKQALFVEQYLPTSIEDALLSKGIISDRNSIVEIGNLYSNTKKFALPLLLTTGVSLFQNNYRYISFCATTHVRALIRHAGIPLVELGNADAKMLSDSNDDWGSYYDTQPIVVVISTLDIMNAINQNPRYLAMFTELSVRIHSASKKLAEVSL